MKKTEYDSGKDSGHIGLTLRYKCKEEIKDKSEKISGGYIVQGSE